LASWSLLPALDSVLQIVINVPSLVPLNWCIRYSAAINKTPTGSKSFSHSNAASGTTGYVPRYLRWLSLGVNIWGVFFYWDNRTNSSFHRKSWRYLRWVKVDEVQAIKMVEYIHQIRWIVQLRFQTVLQLHRGRWDLSRSAQKAQLE
jgi:hypothetical protein